MQDVALGFGSRKPSNVGILTREASSLLVGMLVEKVRSRDGVKSRSRNSRRGRSNRLRHRGGAMGARSRRPRC